MLRFETQITDVTIYRTLVIAHAVVGLEAGSYDDHADDTIQGVKARDTDRLDVKVVDWPSDTQDRMLGLYEDMKRLQATALGGVAGISCFSLSAYVTGGYDVFNGSFDPEHLGYYGPESDIDNLETGQAYVAVGEELPKHVIYGLGPQYRDENLSILGTGGPLAFTNTAECLGAFGADRLLQLDYR